MRISLTHFLISDVHFLCNIPDFMGFAVESLDLWRLVAVMYILGQEGLLAYSLMRKLLIKSFVNYFDRCRTNCVCCIDCAVSNLFG